MQQKSRVTNSFIIRVEDTTRGQVIYLQNLKTQEQLEFDSWSQLCRHLQLTTSHLPPVTLTQSSTK